MKRPTMQMIADALGVSRITVWKVLNNRPGVSPLLRNQIMEKAIQLGYPAPEIISRASVTPASVKAADDPYTISVVVSRPDSSSFWINIIHEIAKEASKKNYSLLYTYVPCDIPDNYVLPPNLTSGSIHGMVVLNVYDPKLYAMLNSLSVPKVFLDCVGDFPLDSVNGDLVILEGERVVEKITDTLIANHNESIGFIGDIRYALTNQLRYEGYRKSMEKHGLPIEEKYCLTSTIGIQTYTAEISDYLDSLDKLPDAFVCVSDFVANCVYQYLAAHDYAIPEDISLSGYDNIQEYVDLTEWLTTVDISTVQVGKRLFHQLDYRIMHPDSNYETIYLNPGIVYRKSTGES